jgi:hypothetical protein
MSELLKLHIETLQNKPIIQLIKNHGRVFLVGGYIRDVLANEKPNDIDLFVLTSNFETLHNALKQTNLYRVDAETKVNYEGLLLSGIKILHTTNQDYKDHVDLIVSNNFDVQNTDFDVNSMYIELEEGARLSTLVGQSLVPMSDDEISKMIAQIKNKKLNISQSVNYLINQKGYATGAKQFMKRCVKRINKGWTLMNTQHNIDVVEYLLNTVNPFDYKQRPMTRHVRVCFGHMLKFLSETGLDYKNFFHDSLIAITDLEGKTGSPSAYTGTGCDETGTMWGFSSRFVFFEDLLNYLANKHSDEISLEECQSMMEYYGTQYVHWTKF